MSHGKTQQTVNAPHYHHRHSPPHHQPISHSPPSPSWPLPSPPPPSFSSLNYRPLFFPERGTPSGRRESLFWNGGSWLNSPRCESDLHVAESAGLLWELEHWTLYEVGTHAGCRKAACFFFTVHMLFSLWLYEIREILTAVMLIY